MTASTWERRWHPLREEWVTLTSHRNTRPWSGAMAVDRQEEPPGYDPDCYLCPGNTRVSGRCNDDYDAVFVFDNDHPAFATGNNSPSPAPGIYRSAPATGICRVICYSPNHGLTLAEMSPAEIVSVIDCWAGQTRELGEVPSIRQVLLFENKGEVVGVSNPHPHGQVYAADIVFPTIAQELDSMNRYRESCGRNLMRDIVATEQDDGRRVIAENEHAIAFVPWFARFPYETFVVPKAYAPYLHELDIPSREGLARILSEVLVRFDNLWQMSFPYMLIVHQAPTDGGAYAAYDCYLQFVPPLRAPGLQKFLAGIETGAGHFLNDGSPEDKAAELLAVSDVHYRTL